MGRGLSRESRSICECRVKGLFRGNLGNVGPKKSGSIYPLLSQTIYTQLCGKIVDKNFKAFMTFMYANPLQMERKNLWRDLEILADSINLPWCALGDFDAYLCSNDKWGGGQPNWTAMNQFKECIQECNLVDLGFKGSNFTWERGRVKERIDRSICNMEWMSRYNSAVVVHLPFFKSDHRLILLKLLNDKVKTRETPFRFLTAWLTNRSFPDLVKKCWNMEKGWMEASSEFRTRASEWSKNFFKKLSRKKSKLMNRIEGINRKLEQKLNWYLEELQKKLWGEYEKLLIQEEITWYQ